MKTTFIQYIAIPSGKLTVSKNIDLFQWFAPLDNVENLMNSYMYNKH